MDRPSLRDNRGLFVHRRGSKTYVDPLLLTTILAVLSDEEAAAARLGADVELCVTPWHGTIKVGDGKPVDFLPRREPPKDWIRHSTTTAVTKKAERICEALGWKFVGL